MSQFTKSLFATPILVGKVNNSLMCESICDLAYNFRDNIDNARLVSDQWNFGTKSSSMKDYKTKGVTSFCSTVNLFELPEWKEATDFIYTFAHAMVDSLNENKYKMEMIDMWTTIYPPGAYVPEHIHSNSYISGVFYAKAKENCGGLSLHDPAWMTKTMYIKTDTPDFPNVSTKYVEKAETGKMILFPSWLPHESIENKSDDDRIILSFNFNFV